MGQRTQLAINIEAVGKDGKSYIEREIFHYQWGGFSFSMFENLIPLFQNVSRYVYLTKYKKYDELNIENGIDKFDILKNNLINVVKSPKNVKTSDVYNNGFNKMSEEEFYNNVFHSDVENGQIYVDIKIEKGKSYCKWCFRKYNYDTEKSKNDFIIASENILKNLKKEIKNYWKFEKNEMECLTKILNFIKFQTEMLVCDNKDNPKEIFKTVEYDAKHFVNKFKNLGKS